jgi:DNA-binding transcriptional regulator YhcF (GntR family)
MMGWKRIIESAQGPKAPFAARSLEVLDAAMDEARRMRHGYVGTEHLLLAITRAAGELFAGSGVQPAEIARSVEAVIQPGDAVPGWAALPFTSRAKKVLEAALGEAQGAGGAEVTPGHLLVGCARVEQGTAAEVLRKHGLDVARVRELARGAAGPSFRVTVDDASELSIYEQIVAQIREAIATGVLSPGERLPTVRQLADELDVAPGTVARAYSELERVGLVKSEGSRGTRVAEQTPPPPPSGERQEILAGLLRPVAVAAFHLGATAQELRTALEEAMRHIFHTPRDAS